MWFLTFNAVLAGLSAVFGVIALLRPQTLVAESSGRFYAAMYASRAIPLGVSTVVAIALSLDLAAVVLLCTAACAQFGDAIIGLCYRKFGMVAAPVIAGSCHIVAAALI